MAKTWDSADRWPTQWVRVERDQTYRARNILPQPEPWMERAACLGQAPKWDRAIDGESEKARLARQREAARICRTACPVVAECRAWADRAETIDDYGVCAGRVSRRTERGRRNRRIWIDLGGGGSMPRAS